MQITMVAAATLDRVIAVDGEMPWHLPDDLRHFHQTVKGEVCVVGRRTYECHRTALASTYCYVVSHSPDARYIQGIDETIDRAIDKARTLNKKEIFILGGETIYHQALPRTDRILLTEVIGEFDYDEQRQEIKRFPKLDIDYWERILLAHHPVQGIDQNSHLFQIINVQPR